MAESNDIIIPDIGGATNVDVIEVLVKPGDEISIDTPLVTLESDKASMEIPSTAAGIVDEVKVRVGDKVSEGDVLLSLRSQETLASSTVEAKEAPQVEPPEPSTDGQGVSNGAQLIDVYMPDIGGATNVDVIEVQVKAGDVVEKETALITLEGDKATMDIPSPEAGTIEAIKIKEGDKVSQGDLILQLLVHTQDRPKSSTTEKKTAPMATDAPKTAPKPPSSQPANMPSATGVYAGPAVRRLANELGVDLNQVKGSGPKSRITKQDVQDFVKSKLSGAASAGWSVPKAPAIDFSKFGEIEVKPLNKIKKLTGEHTHRAWLTIPHVTQFDETDITDLEAFRQSEAEYAKTHGYKLTLLSFVCKAVSKALEAFPQFNASLDEHGTSLIYKKYVHIGIAVETPNGLVVPVIRDVNQRSVGDIAKEMTRLSVKAREVGLSIADMSGGSMTISSLGGIGGTAFTPIVNAPEVAILGLSRSSLKPVYIDGAFQPRLMLPMSLSYDHRVIDGAEAARFTRFLAECISDIRRFVL